MLHERYGCQHVRLCSVSVLMATYMTSRSERFASITFRHRASCILGQAFRYSPENAFYIFNQQIYFIYLIFA